jgi:Na+/H+ antiporter NhaC
MIMNKIDHRYLVVTLVVLVVLFVYFFYGAIMQGGMNERMNENDWFNSSNWRWSPSIVFLFFGITIGWLLYKKKN